MSTKWSEVDYEWNSLSYTWGEVSLALTALQARERLYGELWKKHPDKKKRFIKLIMKVKGKEVKQTQHIRL